MPDYAQAINQHYGQAELSAKILAALREAGKDLEALTRDDLAWTQGVLRNLGDKSRFFAEASRVLRPGGRLAFQASLAGPVPGVYYPTLWADDAQLSFLVSPEACRRLLVATGFHECTWHDVTAQAVAQAQTHRTARSEGASVRAIIAPTNLEERVANRLRNYAEGRVVQVMAVFERPA
jgi:SAM-dependent methyltransferase